LQLEAAVLTNSTPL